MNGDPFPVIITEEVNAIAVAIGKSENMRVTAAVKYTDLWRFVSTPGNDGAQQVIDTGHEPTQEGLWQMVIAHPSYPNKLGTSFRTGQRLLSIGKAPDPEKAHKEEQRSWAHAARARREASSAAPFPQPDRSDGECNKEANPGPDDFLRHPACQNVLRAIIACPPEHWEPLGQYIIAKYRHLHGSSTAA